ncbi:MAG: glycosyltransferase [Bacteroidetes bacterium]|nr:glycosyltransferase [Bacteroidota bacterium]
MIYSVIYFFTFIIFIYLFASTCYLFVIAVAGKFGRKKEFQVNPVKKKILVLIPSYKEDNIILDTARSAANHNYPKDFFKVFVVADKLQPSTVEKLRQIPVDVLQVDVNMKSRSINNALTAIDENEFDIVMILDADNIMSDGCLEKVNDAFNKGYLSVQCHRTAKNKNTPVALLDAISEEININLFRRGPAIIGLSAAPIGSGMAFDFHLIKNIFSSDEILNNPGEDREIDIQLMKRKIKMEFIDDAYVLDEKVANAAVFEKQRIRWLEAQVNHVRRFFHADMKSTPKTSVYYNKFFQNLLLPRVLFLLVFAFIFFLLILQWIFTVEILYPPAVWWIGCFVLYALTLFISIPKAHYNGNTIKALLQVPVLMLSMIKAVLQMKKSRKEFLHTPKSFTEKAD